MDEREKAAFSERLALQSVGAIVIVALWTSAAAAIAFTVVLGFAGYSLFGAP